MLVGHRRNIAYLERVLERRNPAHAYLFHGPEAVGKRTVARELAKSLLCSRQSSLILGGCGQCEDCRTVEAGTHPDAFAVSPHLPAAAEEHAPGIGIKSVHELQRRVAHTPWRGGRKIVIVDGAEQLSRDAQAALLKLLEEPGANVVFFLITSAPGALVPTVISRSVSVGFPLVEEEAMMPLLEDVPAPRRQLFLSLAQGRPGVLVRLVRDKKFFETGERSHIRFQELRTADLVEQLAFSEEARREPERLASWFFFLLGSLARELRARAEAAAERPDPSSDRILPLAHIAGALLRANLLLETTAVNRRLLADGVFFNLQILK